MVMVAAEGMGVIMIMVILGVFMFFNGMFNVGIFIVVELFDDFVLFY